MDMELNRIFKLLDSCEKASDDVCISPTADNCKKLELINDMAIAEVQAEIIRLRKAKQLIEKSKCNTKDNSNPYKS